MKPHLPDYIVKRLRERPPSPYVVAGSTPVLSFGDASKAVVVTLGLNPSRREFLDKAGRELIDGDRRFETLKSPGVRPLTKASDGQRRKVVEACNNYFVTNPYEWFDPLKPILQAVGASYSDGTACPVDLVQWGDGSGVGQNSRSQHAQSIT